MLGSGATQYNTVKLPDRNLTFRLTYTDKHEAFDSDAKTPNFYFENVTLAGYAGPSGGKLRYKQADLTLSGHPAREYQIENQYSSSGAVSHVRTVVLMLDKRHTLIVTMEVMGSDSKPDTPEVRRFFNSLRLPAKP